MPCQRSTSGGRQNRERRFFHHSLSLVRDITENRLLSTDVGFVSYRLARHILRAGLEAAVAAGDAAVFVDPESGQRLYVFVERG